MSVFAKIWAGLRWFGRLFTTQAAKDAFKLVDEMLPHVAPIVRLIRDIVPNVSQASFEDIKAAYSAFGKAIGDIRQDTMGFGMALAELALMVARERIADSSIPTRILKAAIELALVALKAKR